MPYELLIGDCIESMRQLPEKSINCCVTSPPYFGLRDYGVEGQIGLEETPELYVQRMVEVFREVKRVLRDDGTLWLNIGDSYAANRSYQVPSTKGGPKHSDSQSAGGKGSKVPEGLKSKDLIGIPWMLAFALRADGWYLRQEIIWHKPNPMPESVKDRCTKAHEQIFLLSKSQKYYFDSEAMQEPAVGGQSGAAASFKRKGSKREQTIPNQSYGTHREDREDVAYNRETRNRRSVWSVATRPYKGAHFATFPPDLIEPCILAGCPDNGTVLDPFGGSGTTAGVAIAHGRKAVLCEINKDYTNLIPQRISDIISRNELGAPTVITIIEYNADNKPTGRYCRMPETTPELLNELLPLYGYTGTYSRYVNQLRDYNTTGVFCHVYSSSMPGAVGTAVGLDELLAP